MTSNGCRCGLKKEKIRGWSGQACGVLVSAGQGWRLFVDCLWGLGADMGSLIFFFSSSCKIPLRLLTPGVGVVGENGG